MAKKKLASFSSRVAEWVSKSGKKADLDKIIREHRKAYHAAPLRTQQQRHFKEPRSKAVGVDSTRAKSRQKNFIKEKIRELDRDLETMTVEPFVRRGMRQEMTGLRAALKTLRDKKSNVSKLTLPSDRSRKRTISLGR
jgi:FMN phosphatase YigB (HAD superfamily)